MSKHFETKATNGSVYKIILQEDGPTYMIFAFSTSHSERAEEDRFASDLAEAKQICLLKWGVSPDDWADITDPRSIEYLRESGAEGF